jgi:hypothetical protein
MMASIGIVKGQPFTPDARHREILDKAAQVAPKMAQALNVSPTALPERLYYDGDVKRYWINAYSGVDDKFSSNGYLNVDVRSTFFLMAYSSAPFMNANRPGLGARYPTTFYDAEGEYLVGDHTYRLHLPPDIPAALFWAVTLYSPVNGTMIDNGQPFPSINSLVGTVKQETDGSYDLYFAPELPAEVSEGELDQDESRRRLRGCAAPLRRHDAVLRPNLDPRRRRQGVTLQRPDTTSPGQPRDARHPSLRLTSGEEATHVRRQGRIQPRSGPLDGSGSLRMEG